MEIKSNGEVDLPQELVEDILLRLPVKILSRCKCVSKNWCDLIESPSFVKQHFERQQERLLIRLMKKRNVDEPVAEEPHQMIGEDRINYFDALFMDDDELVQEIPDQEAFNNAHALFVADMIEDQRRQQMIHEKGYKYASFVDEIFSEYEDPIHLQIPDGTSDVFGPLNGVFCVVYNFPLGPMALLNPALRQFKPLPLVQQINLANISFYGNVLGFGLEPLTGDYKLVLILFYFDKEERRCFVCVCTSDSDSWRVLEDVDSINLSGLPLTSLCNTYMNGAYYWLMYFNETTDAAILAFDMGTDKFRKIQVDGCVDQSRSGFLSLFRDSLALLIYDEASTCIDVWLMVNEANWIKSLRVGPLEGIRRPLCFWKNSELLLESMTSFLTQCNVSTQELKTFGAQRTDQWLFSHWVFTYKESLVSIKGKAGKCKIWDISSNFLKNFFKDSSRQKVKNW